jgi:hypothetical protein
MTVALTADGHVFTFGSTYNKQLGRPMDGAHPSTRIIPRRLDLIEKIVDISVGSTHTILLSESGVAYTYGTSTFGELARPIIFDETDGVPTPILPFSSKREQEKIVKICAGRNSSAFITASGRVYVSGLLQSNRQHVTEPDIEINGNVTAVDEGPYYMRVLKGKKVTNISLGHTSLISVVEDSRTDLYNAVSDVTLRQTLGDVKLIVRTCLKENHEHQVLVNRAIVSRNAKLASMINASLHDGQHSIVHLGVVMKEQALDVFVQYLYTDRIMKGVKSWIIDDLWSIASLLDDNRLKNIIAMINRSTRVELIEENTLHASLYITDRCLPAQTLSRDMQLLLESEKYSDVSFRVLLSSPQENEPRYRIVKAHKCVLCARSSYFKAMLTGGMTEASETNVIDLTQNEDSPVRYEPFMCIIEYLYTGGISERLNDELICEVALLANQCSLPVFQEVCEDLINERILNRVKHLESLIGDEINDILIMPHGSMEAEQERTALQGDVNTMMSIAEVYNLVHVQQVCQQIQLLL